MFSLDLPAATHHNQSFKKKQNPVFTGSDETTETVFAPLDRATREMGAGPLGVR